MVSIFLYNYQYSIPIQVEHIRIREEQHMRGLPPPIVTGKGEITTPGLIYFLFLPINQPPNKFRMQSNITCNDIFI